MQGTLSIVFASLVIIVVIAALVVCVRSVRVGGMPTTEEPDTPSHYFAPSSFLTTPTEKQVAAEWANSGLSPVPSGTGGGH